MSWSVINAKKKTVKCYKLAPVAKRLARNTDECIDDSNFSNFKFSEDWIRGFMKRKKLCNRAITHKAQEKTTVNYETTSIVKSFVGKKSKETKTSGNEKK